LIKDSICRQTGDKWYMQQYICRDQRWLLLIYIQIMKPPISIERERG
jgi:hypothetical protein